MKNAFARVAGEEIEGKSFISRRASAGLENKIAENKATNENRYGRKLKRVFVILCVLSIAFLFPGMICLELGSEMESFAAFYDRYRIFFFVSIGLAVLEVPLYLGVFSYVRKLASSPDYLALMQKQEKDLKESREELGVPDSAQAMEVLTYALKYKNGEKKRKGLGNSYENRPVQIFKEDDKLCFFDETYVLSLPISSIREVVFVQKGARIECWKKDTPYNKGEYKQYKIRNDNNGVSIKGYYSVRFSGYNEEFEILIPLYDAKIFFALTGGRFGQ